MAKTIIKKINDRNVSVGNFVVPTPIRAFPNPVQNTVRLLYVGQESKELRVVDIEVIDVNGNLIIDGATPGVTRSQVVQAINNYTNIS